MAQLTDPKPKSAELNWPSKEEFLIAKDSIIPTGQKLTVYFNPLDSERLRDEVTKEAIQFCAGKCSPEEIKQMAQRKADGILNDKLSTSATASSCYINLEPINSSSAFKEYLKRDDIPDHILKLMAQNVANHELFHCTQYRMGQSPVSALLKEVEADAVPATSMLVMAYRSKDSVAVKDAVDTINEIINLRVRNEDAKYYSSIIYLRKLLTKKPEQLLASIDKDGLRFTIADLLEETMKDVSLFDLYKSYGGKNPRE